eukprot:6325723-Karenia_brevis.AAC.1
MCGTAHLSKAIAQAALDSEGWDIEDGPGADLLDSRVVDSVLRRIGDTRIRGGRHPSGIIGLHVGLL